MPSFPLSARRSLCSPAPARSGAKSRPIGQDVEPATAGIAPLANNTASAAEKYINRSMSARHCAAKRYGIVPATPYVTACLASLARTATLRRPIRPKVSMARGCAPSPYRRSLVRSAVSAAAPGLRHASLTVVFAFAVAVVFVVALAVAFVFVVAFAVAFVVAFA